MSARAYFYVLPCAYEDLVKLGFSRDPLQRMRTLHPRYFEIFDLDQAFIVAVDSVREARQLELSTKRALRLHRAPAPLIINRHAGGDTEWLRGAYAQLSSIADRLAVDGYAVYRPLRTWLRNRLLDHADRLYAFENTIGLDIDESSSETFESPVHLQLRNLLDAYIAVGIELHHWLPERMLRWHQHQTRQPL